MFQFPHTRRNRPAWFDDSFHDLSHRQMSRSWERHISSLLYKWRPTSFSPLSLLYYLHFSLLKVSKHKLQDLNQHHERPSVHYFSIALLCHPRTRILYPKRRKPISVRTIPPQYVIRKLICSPGLQIRAQTAAGQHRMGQTLPLTPTTPEHVESALSRMALDLTPTTRRGPGTPGTTTWEVSWPSNSDLKRLLGTLTPSRLARRISTCLSFQTNLKAKHLKYQ